MLQSTCPDLRMPPMALDSSVKSFAHLLAHRDAAYLLALRLTGNSADAEDAVQDAFLSTTRYDGPIPRGDEGRVWFLRVVANAARKLRSRDAGRRLREGKAAMDAQP